MLHLISVNSKFFNGTPEQLINVWSNSAGIVDGAEVYVDVNNVWQCDYLERLAVLMGRAGLVLQIHAPTLDVLSNPAVLGYFDSLAKGHGSTMKLTAHPTHSEVIPESIDLSMQHIKSIEQTIEFGNLDLKLCLENLNDINGWTRPKVSDIDYLLYHSDSDTGFCWDIGHDVHAGNESYSLNHSLISRLRNVHIHDLRGAEDHHPFVYGNVNVMLAIGYLAEIGYDGTVVHELALDYLPGQNFEERHDIYIEEMARIESFFLLNKQMATVV